MANGKFKIANVSLPESRSGRVAHVLPDIHLATPKALHNAWMPTPKALYNKALRHESVGKEDERCDEPLKPFEGTLRVKFPSGRAGRQPEASLACRLSNHRCEA